MYNWAVVGSTKKRKISEETPTPSVKADDKRGATMSLLKPSPANIYTLNNSIYYNGDITYDNAFSLNRELRALDDKHIQYATQYRTEPPPIYLHITTYGGLIHAAFSIVDCIKSLRSPLYTVVDGFVASAGTLISLAGEKRYMQPNAYMLFHELRSEFWGKMSDIDQEYYNLKKIMEHLADYYTRNTSLTKKSLEKLLTKDAVWNVQECLEKGVVGEIYKAKM